MNQGELAVAIDHRNVAMEEVAKAVETVKALGGPDSGTLSERIRALVGLSRQLVAGEITPAEAMSFGVDGDALAAHDEAFKLRARVAELEEAERWIPVPPKLPMSQGPIPEDELPLVDGPLPEDGATVLLTHKEEGWQIVCVVRARHYFSWPRGCLEFVFISEVEKSWIDPSPIRGTHWRPLLAGPT